MALRKILVDGDPMLRKKSKEVTIFDNNLKELFDDMYETLKKADGAGIACIHEILCCNEEYFSTDLCCFRSRCSHFVIQ